MLPKPTINYEIPANAFEAIRNRLRQEYKYIQFRIIAPAKAWLRAYFEAQEGFSFPRHIAPLTDEAVIVMLRQGARGGLSVAFQTRTGTKREQRHGEVATRNRHPADMEAEYRAYRDIHVAMRKWFSPWRKKKEGWA